MAKANRTYKCLNCGGNLEWSPKLQKLRCPFCESEFSLSDYEKTEQEVAQDIAHQQYQKGEEASAYGYSAGDATDDSNIDPEDLRIYRCSSCGAEVITDKTTVATTCAFCGNPVVLTEQLDTEFKPKWIIPFKVDRDQIRQIYSEYIKTRPFAPKGYQTEAVLEKIKAVYIPFWLYRMHMQGEVSAHAEKRITTADSRYVYTTHMVYRLDRAGTLEVRNLPVDASSKAPNDAMDSIEPYDLNELKPFRLPYMAGFLAERYDEDEEFCRSRAVDRANVSMENELQKTLTGYSTIQITGQKVGEMQEPVQADYTLLPVYLMMSKYKDKDYLFAINGQTGKAVGDVPVSTGKAALFCGACFTVLFTIFSVIGMMLF